MKTLIGENIKKYRKLRGMTQEEFANQIGVTAQAVSKWEALNGMPDITLLVPIAQNLSVTIDTLFGMDDVQDNLMIIEKVNENIASIKREYSQPDSLVKICEYLKEEIESNPTCYELTKIYLENMASLSISVDFDGYLKDKGDAWKRIMEDGIKKAMIAIKHSSNREIIDKIHYALAWIYIHEKEYDKARTHIEVLPSLKSGRLQENILDKLALFEGGFANGIEETSKVMENSLYLYIYALGSKFVYDLETYTWFKDKEFALKYGNYAIGVMEKLFEKAALDRKEIVMPKLYYFITLANLKGKDVEAAVASFNKACEYPINRDNYRESLRECGNEKVYEEFVSRV
ncbi:MAG: helix-turn-helix transcriptional regulator [Lachnospiraceae bacterium]|nr:helix-turn-helix transcriptional regulator [Lachnospiraceae bacterium]